MRPSSTSQRQLAPRLHAIIVVRPQKAELLCRHLLERGLLAELTVAETLGLSSGGRLPRAELHGLIDARDVDDLIELVASLGRSSLAGDGKIFLRPVTREVEL